MNVQYLYVVVLLSEGVLYMYTEFKRTTNICQLQDVSCEEFKRKNCNC